MNKDPIRIYTEDEVSYSSKIYSYECEECQQSLSNGKEARIHAALTGHVVDGRSSWIVAGDDWGGWE